MRNLLLFRLATAVLVFSFLFGLPMQGIAMAAQVSFAVSADAPMPDNCDGCGDDPGVSNNCIAVFCAGFPGVVAKDDVSDQTVSNSYQSDPEQRSAGLLLTPDPSPPRTSLLS